MHKGSCLCGDVSFEVSGDISEIGACHCSICRKTSGHYWAAVTVPADNIKIDGYTYIRWFRSSQNVRRGFCEGCGASLFYIKDGSKNWEVAAGCFDTPLPKLTRHIHIDQKPDYYDL